MLETKNLSYTYDAGSPHPIKAIQNISMSVQNGEIIGIIGPTGSGKSTLAQMLNGLLKPTGGQIFLNSKNIWVNFKNIQDVHFKVGLVFQYPEQQLFAQTVFDEIAFGLKNKGISENQLKEKVTKSMQIVGLDDDLIDKSPFDLSGGEKRRCAIASVICMEPDVLILDEPTSGLDFFGRKNLIKSILEYHKRNNNIIIFISHIMEEIAEIANKVLVLDSGKTVMFDSPQNVFSKIKKLENIGLDVPRITKIMSIIQKKDYNLKENIVTVQEAETEILKLLRSKAGAQF